MASESDNKSSTNKAKQKAGSTIDAAGKKSAEVIKKAQDKSTQAKGASSSAGNGPRPKASSKPDPVVIKGEATVVDTKAPATMETDMKSDEAAPIKRAAAKGAAAGVQDKTKSNGSSKKVQTTKTNTNTKTKTSAGTSSAAPASSAGQAASKPTQSTTSTAGGASTGSSSNNRGSGGSSGSGNTSVSSSKLGGIALALSALSLGLGGWLYNRTSVDAAEQTGATTGVQATVSAVSEQFDDVKNQVAGVTEQVAKLGEDLTTVKSTTKDSLSSSKAELSDQINAVKAQTADDINSVKSQISAAVGKIRSDDLALVQKTQADRTKQVGEIRAEVAELSGSVDRVYGQLDESLGRWQLQEVEQLMVTANDRLNLAGDVAIAQTAMKFADDRMRDMKDPSLADVRGQVANDLSALAAVEQVDVPGLAARIRTLAGSMDGLALNRAGFQPEPSAGDNQGTASDSTDDSANDDGGGLFAKLSGSITSVGQGALAKLDESTKATKSYIPPLAPDQKYFITENLRLKYSTAQLALFERDQDTYAASLAAASEWIQKYFQPDAGGASDAVAEIGKLANVVIDPELPDISGSLQELRKVITSRAAK